MYIYIYVCGCVNGEFDSISPQVFDVYHPSFFECFFQIWFWSILRYRNSETYWHLWHLASEMQQKFKAETTRTIIRCSFGCRVTFNGTIIRTSDSGFGSASAARGRLRGDPAPCRRWMASPGSSAKPGSKLAQRVEELDLMKWDIPVSSKKHKQMLIWNMSAFWVVFLHMSVIAPLYE